jgi:hypothetical protein
MADFEFEDAVRQQMPVRMVLQGPAGSGKTITAFKLMRALIGPTGRFAVIDTEQRAREYAVTVPGGPEGEFEYNFGRIAPTNADPTLLPDMMRSAAKRGYDGVVIDSFTHFWSGQGGALDRIDGTYDKRAGWAAYRPIQAKMMASILTYPGPVIATLRVKAEYVTEANAKGKQVVRRLGTKPDQRDTTEYEFPIIGDIDQDHTLTFSKTTCQELVDRSYNRPGADVADVLLDWAGRGVPPPTTLELRDRVMSVACDSIPKLTLIWDEIAQRELMDAPVETTSGEQTTLRAICNEKGRELRELESRK